MTNLSWLPRALGAATAAYSVVIIVRPAVLARPCGPADSPAVRTLIGGIGVRDIAIAARSARSGAAGCGGRPGGHRRG